LKENNLDQQQRLSQSIKVNPQWTHALETVISIHLHDICIDDINSYLGKLESAPGKFGLMNTKSSTFVPETKQFPRLIVQITTELRVPSILENIYLAESLEQAKVMLPNLSVGQSVVTEKGIWLSHDWVIVNNASDTNDSILNREEEISLLKLDLGKRESEIQAIEYDLKTTEEGLEQVETTLNEQQSLTSEQQQGISDIRTKLASSSDNRPTK